MTYPTFKGKHLEEALFNPHDYLKYAKHKEKFPKKAILTYQDSVLRYFRRKFKGKYEIKKFAGAKVHILREEGIVFAKIDGIGSPNAVIVFEDLIAAGVKEFINIGTAGGLQREGVFLCDGAVRDEGTSYHYHAHEKFAYPDEKLTEKFRKILEKKDVEYERGLTWTIDAPYRETKKEIEYHRRRGIVTVEMEASALFTVAKLRNVKIASAFVVSDTLFEEWTPKFHHIDMKSTLNKLLDCAIECLEKDNFS